MPRTIYMIADGEDGYATADNERAAHALVKFGQFKIVNREEYQRVKAIVDTKSGTDESEG